MNYNDKIEYIKNNIGSSEPDHYLLDSLIRRMNAKKIESETGTYFSFSSNIWDRPCKAEGLRKDYELLTDNLSGLIEEIKADIIERYGDIEIFKFLRENDYYLRALGYEINDKNEIRICSDYTGLPQFGNADKALTILFEYFGFTLDYKVIKTRKTLQFRNISEEQKAKLNNLLKLVRINP